MLPYRGITAQQSTMEDELIISMAFRNKRRRRRRPNVMTVKQ